MSFGSSCLLIYRPTFEQLHIQLCKLHLDKMAKHAAAYKCCKVLNVTSIIKELNLESGKNCS